MVGRRSRALKKTAEVASLAANGPVTYASGLVCSMLCLNYTNVGFDLNALRYVRTRSLDVVGDHPRITSIPHANGIICALQMPYFPRPNSRWEQW